MTTKTLLTFHGFPTSAQDVVLSLVSTLSKFLEDRFG